MAAASPASADPTPDIAKQFGVTVADPAGLKGPLFLATEDDGTVQLGYNGRLEPQDRSFSNCHSLTKVAVPVGGAWHTSVDGCSLIGSSDDAQHGYEFYQDGNSRGTPCVRGRGYAKKSGSWTAQYEAIGCGASGKRNVRIGKVITVAKVQAQSLGLFGSAIEFR